MMPLNPSAPPITATPMRTAEQAPSAASTPPLSGAAPATASSPIQVHAVLDQVRQRPWWQRRNLWLGLLVLTLAGAGLWWWLAQQESDAAPRYITEPAHRGNLTLTVAANGTLQPTRLVNIGSELSGTVLNVLADVNDTVKAGQILVELDTAKLAAQVQRSRAALDSAQARLLQASATVRESQASLARLQEVARLSGGKVPSVAELDGASAVAERARADERSMRASIDDARAALSTDETSLSKASIRSPIKGMVLTRSVEPGNAVAASLQAVTLFTLAEDLTRLKLEVKVDEADVGAVQKGQKATFTVSAYPSRKYPALIRRVAYGSTLTDNVVTYTATLDVDNSDLSLRPGMTASATITARERIDALLVPNTALRYSPSQKAVAEAKSAGGILSRLIPRMPRSGPRGGAGVAAGKQVWVLRDGQPVAVPVTLGISDGRMTEILAGALQAGTAVITDQQAAGAAP